RMAYFFDFDYPDGRQPRDYVVCVKNAIDEWYKVRNPEMKPEDYARLDATIAENDDIVIHDTRPCASQSSRLVSGLEAEILLRCDTSQSAGGLTKSLGATDLDVRAALASLMEQKLMIEMDGQYGSLPVLRNRRQSGQIGAPVAHTQIQEPAAAESLLRII
ncbi:MAG: hypothetical protein ABI822_22845, partial [Bryobacteraceae bacterium]